MKSWPGLVVCAVVASACEREGALSAGEGLLGARAGGGVAARVAGLSPAPDWILESPQWGASLAWSPTSAGDVNGDGFGDVVVGASTYDDGQTDEGAVAVFSGSSAGLGAAPAWTAQANQADARFGLGSAAGDVDGDGFSDLVVGAQLYDGALVDDGAAFLYRGSAAGLVAAPSWTSYGGQASSRYGVAIATADVNGDGFIDVLVAAPYDDDGVLRNAGAVAVHHGSPAGLSPVPDLVLRGAAGSAFGQALASAGDVNADGFEDVIFGAPYHTDPEQSEGAAYLFLGSPNGLSRVPAWNTQADDAGAHLGISVAGAGDVNGDGFADVVIGAEGYDGTEIVEGLALVYLGSPAGLEATPAWSALGGQAGAELGSSVAGAGDVNADGYGDVAVAAPGLDQDGAVFVYMGSPAGVQAEPLLVVRAEEPDNLTAFLGVGLSSAGDVDADGDDELLVGMGSPERVLLFEGRVVPDTDGDGIYDPVDDCPAVPDPGQADDDGDGVGNACDAPSLAIGGTVSVGEEVSLVASGAGPGESVTFAAAPGAGGPGPCVAGACLSLGPRAIVLGAAVADSTGVARLAVVAPPALVPQGPYSLQAAIARGPGGVDSVASPVVTLDGDDLDWDGDGLPDGDETVWGTDPTVADSDGDGLADGAELAPFFDPLAADADGDGIPDGADACPAGDDGSDPDADGVATACDRCPDDVDAAQADSDGDGLGDACDGRVLVGPVLALTTNQAYASLGVAVASAGDVNGDGYDDVIVGAPSLDDPQQDEGAAFVHLGSAAGPSPVASWSWSPDLVGYGFGRAVASAGDVNGDGYGDIVVGAPLPGPLVGGVSVFYGSAAGLPATASWSAAGSQPFAAFGDAVASAGDVDGDGFDDLVVGAYGGRSAFLYRGSAVGLEAAPSWSVTAADPWGEFGFAVGSAGDVNGDGYSDVLVGDPWAGGGGGAAHLYLGSAAGLSPVAAWTAAIEADRGALGASVAGAGDVNGDGYDDVVIGAPDHEVSDGAAFVYLGWPLGLRADPVLLVDDSWAHDTLGDSVACAGDVNGDGFDDVLVGSRTFTDGEIDEGKAWLFLGSAEGVRDRATWEAASNRISALFGAAVAGAGDVNGDGFADVIVGAPGFSDPEVSEGAVLLFTGARP